MRRLLTLLLALMLATGILAANAPTVGAWNYYTWKDAAYTCGAQTSCQVQFFVQGGGDQVDWIQGNLIQYCSYGQQVSTFYNGQAARGWYTRYVWIGIGCHSSWVEIHSYDQQYADQIYVSPIW